MEGHNESIMSFHFYIIINDDQQQDCFSDESYARVFVTVLGDRVPADFSYVGDS